MNDPETKRVKKKSAGKSGGSRGRSERPSPSQWLWTISLLLGLLLFSGAWLQREAGTARLTYDQFEKRVRSRQLSADNVRNLILGRDQITFQVVEANATEPQGSKIGRAHV
mgnify:CR=1 FL=1